ncbi:thioredoxin-like protein [Pseudomassariella vexata]|uniref:Thioredoxin-like protein n=1 Tax=Pseudomassariella vexata TaxID=1141098 RepID=A0A1Y2E3V6_9PEZI|nr:thioredoxin-like protein [Pseudomassariella vexata]ORY65555.1 thioredoxin-like protein [Pseudomassariella vexata]
MRLLSLALFLGASVLGAAQAIGAELQDDPARENTYFNGKKVPPLLELTADNFEKEVKQTKYLVVKYFSPYCPHCIDFAPTYQTLYEYYYTSQGPVDPESDPPQSFEKYYDIRFASLNCVAYGDMCTKHNIESYPQTMLYKDGVLLDRVKGGKPMLAVAELVETELKKEFSGTRPKELVLPKPGATSVPAATDSEATELKAKSAVDKEDEGKKADNTGATSLSATADSEATELKAKSEVGKADEVEKADKINAADKSDKSEKSDKTEKPKADKAAEEEPTKVDEKAPVKVEKTKPAKPTVTPNEKGLSMSLTAESFQTLVTMTQEPWFIKFYAPWCHHCQAMSANWQQLAKEMKGRLNIGEVNCDAESRLCKDVRIRGYPTIHFFKGGERVEYDGLRGLGDFVKYAEKAMDVCSGVQEVDAASFRALEEKEEVIFVYFYDHATTTEDMMALERLPLSLIGHAKLVKTKDPELYDRFKITTWPRLLVAREGRPTYYTPLTPKEMRDTRQVLTWMKSVWLPIVPELTASNAREIMDGKIVVLGIINREDQESFLGAKREMKSAANEWMDKQIQLFQLERQELRDAKQLRIEEAEDRNDQRALRAAKSIRINMDRSDRKEVAFAWVDGIFWQRWIRTTYGIDVKDGERVIINDEDNRRYWDTTITGNYIIPSRTSILETISKVTASPPKIKPKLTISSFEKIFFDIRITFSEHPYLTIGCVAGLALGCASWFRGRLRRNRGHFRLEDTLPIKELKDGLLGNTANGKVD